MGKWSYLEMKSWVKETDKKTRLSFEALKEFRYVDGSVWSGQGRFRSFCVQPGFEISLCLLISFFFFPESLEQCLQKTKKISMSNRNTCSS